MDVNGQHHAAPAASPGTIATLQEARRPSEPWWRRQIYLSLARIESQQELVFDASPLISEKNTPVINGYI
jgi:hypothetical protein